MLFGYVDKPVGAALRRPPKGFPSGEAVSIL